MAKKARGKISWAKASVFIVLIIILALGYAYIHFTLFTGGSFRLHKSIDTNLQSSIDSFVERSPNITGVQIVKVDLQKNVRYIVYTSIKHPEARKLYSNFLSDNITTQLPVFTNNNLQDLRMVSIINHEFICYPFKDTLSYDIIPKMAQYVTTVCATTVPVDPNKFSGFVAVFLTKEPSKTEIDLVRIESIKLSQEAAEAIK